MHHRWAYYERHTTARSTHVSIQDVTHRSRINTDFTYSRPLSIKYWEMAQRSSNDKPAKGKGLPEVQSTHYNPYVENPSSSISCIALSRLGRQVGTWSHRVVVIDS